jgi:signal transduction histidine kinase
MFDAISRRVGNSSRSFGRFLIACMVIGFASLLVAGIATLLSIARTERHNLAVTHTYEVQLAIARANVLIEQAETTRRGYIIGSQQAYLDSYRETNARIPAALDRIRALTADNPRQQANIARFRVLVADIQARRDRTNALVSTGHPDEAARAFTDDTNARRMRAIRDLGQAMEKQEQQLLAIRDAEQRASMRSFYVTLSIAGFLLLFVAIASLLTILRYTRDLADSRDTLRDFADSLEELVNERTADLSRANAEIQRFAYIVSHDLRAPLVNVMGFTAELDTATGAITELIDRAEETAPAIVTEEARFAIREELPEAIGFIRTSTEKMDRLINAILRLSREGRRVITPEPIDMAALIGTIGATLQHIMIDRDARLAIADGLPNLVSDRLAIEQIFSNLIENAVKYLQPGRPGLIEVRGSVSGARILYEVADNGRGIAPADHQRVFDLFRRSGNQDQPGEGIGLAHVRALAYRLGGVIDVQSELGKGATFRLSLPASPVDLQGNKE